MPSTILQGSVFDLLPTIAPGSVDCVITSPPYWRLRSYLPQSHALKPLELGSEKTPAGFVQTMVRVFGLVREMMADHAVAFVNVGDTYFADSPVRNSSAEAFSETWDTEQTASNGGPRRSAKCDGGLKPGDLTLIPQRLAIALQDAGWYVRSIIAWHKPAPMPGSMSGWRWERCRVKEASKVLGTSKKSHNGNRSATGGTWEGGTQWSPCPGCPKCSPNDGFILRRGRWRPTSAWEPILMLAKSEKYFADGEAARQPHKEPWRSTGKLEKMGCGKNVDAVEDGVNNGFGLDGIKPRQYNPAGANLRDVWTIAAEPLHYFCFRCMASCRADGKTRRCPRCGDKVHTHFAAFPTELVYRCLASGTSSRGYCTQCGLPWVRIVEKPEVPLSVRCRTILPDDGNVNRGKRIGGVKYGSGQKVQDWLNEHPTKTLGWKASCRCNADARPGLVLDPFAGSGRTGIQCARMGLDFIGIELSPDNAAMARALIREEMPLFA